MEKITIKNFGPIKEFELEIKQFTILIGEQSSGKSTIAKILSLLKDAFVIIGIIGSESRIKHFGLYDYFQKDSLIKYDCEDYSVICKSPSSFKVTPKSDILKELKSDTKSMSHFFATSGIVNSNSFHDTLINLGVSTSVYIPAERILISSISSSPFDYLNEDIKLPEYLASFGKIFQETRKEINEFSVSWLKAKYSYSKNENWITYKGKKTRMSESATGFQNVIPLLLAFEKPTKIDKSQVSYFIEEPELSLFPVTQYHLVKHLVEKCRALSTPLLITTHSPYVLSAFNNLIYAHKVGKKNSKRTESVINKKYWIDPKNVAALYLNDKGKADDIMDRDLDQIAVEKIDEISRVINGEFDKLFNIESK